MDDKKRIALVLFSGGWESTLCLALALRAHGEECVRAVCIDYGQVYAFDELRATKAIVKAMTGGTRILTTLSTSLPSWHPGDVIIPGRNAHLLRVALASTPGVTDVYFGSRAPARLFDKYGDSNYAWGTEMGRAFGVTMHMPCTLHPKWLVKKRVTSLTHLNPYLIFSSEGVPA